MGSVPEEPRIPEKEVWLSTDTLMLDARSLLGLMALVGQRVHVVAEDDVDPKRFSRLVEKMA